MNETWAISSLSSNSTSVSDDSLTQTGKIIVGAFMGVVALICFGAGLYFFYLWKKSKKAKGQVATAGLSIITNNQTTRDD